MSTVEEIKRAIATLSLEERAELLSSLNDFEDDEWDRQMKADAAAGKFKAMNERIQADLAAGRLNRLDEVIKEA
jgi:hypothetical protein